MYSATNGIFSRRPGIGRLLLSASLAVSLAACAGGQRPRAAATGGTTIAIKLPAPPTADDAALALLSATPGAYDYHGIKSVSVDGQPMAPEAALDQLNRSYAAIVAQTPAESDPLHGSARIVLADHDRLRPMSAVLFRFGGDAAVDFVTEQNRLNEHAVADVLARSHLFTAVTVVEQNDTDEPAAEGADYVIWYQVRSATPNNAGPWSGHWRLKRAGNPAVGSITFDPGTAAGLPRFESFLKSVRLAVANPAATASAGDSNTSHALKGGSGIVIDGRGNVLTNNHVIAGCEALRVTDTGGTASPATLVAADAANDLALLGTERHPADWAGFRDSHGLRPGEPLVVTGFPLAGLVSPDMAVNTGSLTALSGLRGDSRQFQFSAPVQPGNSGGPVIDDSGRVVGIATAELNGLAIAAATGTLPQNVNFAIKSSTARTFLEAHDITLDTAAAGQRMTAAEVGDVARKFTVKVECVR
jgi:S1-C subfamily serine protease